MTNPANKAQAQIVLVISFDGLLWSTKVAIIDHIVGPFPSQFIRVIADAAEAISQPLFPILLCVSSAQYASWRATRCIKG